MPTFKSLTNYYFREKTTNNKYKFTVKVFKKGLCLRRLRKKKLAFKACWHENLSSN